MRIALTCSYLGLLLVFAITNCGAIAADSPPGESSLQKEDTTLLKRLQEKGQQALGKGDYSLSAGYAEKAVEIATRLSTQGTPAVKEFSRKALGDCLMLLGNSYEFRSENEAAEAAYLRCLKVRERGTDPERLADCLGGLARVYMLRAKHTQARQTYERLLGVREAQHKKEAIAQTLHNIAITYFYESNFPKAMETVVRSMKIHEELKDTVGLALCNSMMGTFYTNQRNYITALDYHLKSLKLYEQAGALSQLGGAYGFIGEDYYGLKQIEKSLEYHEKSLALHLQNNNKTGIGSCYNNIGDIYEIRQEYAKALTYYQKALAIREEVHDDYGIATCYINMGREYTLMKNPRLALEYNEKGLALSRKIQNLALMSLCYKGLAEAHALAGQYKEAYARQVEFKKLNDSIFNTENSKQLGDLRMNMEVEKKESELKIISQAEKDKLKAVAAEEEKKQRVIIYAVAGILLVVLIFSIFLYKRFVVTKEQKNIIGRQKEEVEQQKELVEHKQKEILDSIAYAKRIQEAILPPMRLVNQYLPDTFILYKPKDIVAGDFYWIEKVRSATGKESSGLLLLAAADCTGHGVPGALVSIVCNNALNRAVREYRFFEPGPLLDKTRELVIEQFEKSDSEVKDGMDISLVSICPLEEDKVEVKYAGANNPLWIVRRDTNQVEEVKGDKQPIGKYAEQKPYQTHRLVLQKHDCIYLFTDGYADQFGGPKGKKFKYAQLKDLLAANAHKSMREQEQILEEALSHWKGSQEQVDDVCVIGLRV